MTKDEQLTARIKEQRDKIAQCRADIEKAQESLRLHIRKESIELAELNKLMAKRTSKYLALTKI